MYYIKFSPYKLLFCLHFDSRNMMKKYIYNNNYIYLLSNSLTLYQNSALKMCNENECAVLSTNTNLSYQKLKKKNTFNIKTKWSVEMAFVGTPN